MEYIIGIDVGGTTIKYGLFDMTSMELIKKHEKATPKIEVIKTIYEGIKEILDDAKVDIKQCQGIGLAVPCPIRNGYVESCVNINWHDQNIVSEIKEILPDHMTVVASNDATLAAFGENMLLEKPLANAVFYTLGTGIGGGVIINGDVLEGFTGLAGEIGHLKVSDGDENQRCGCGGYGCLEQTCGTYGILSYAEELRKQEETILNDANPLSMKTIFDAAKVNDKVGTMIVNRFCEYLAISMVNISLIINPEIFIIGGGVSKAGDFLLHKIRYFFDKHARFTTSRAKIVLAKSGNDAGIYGSAYYLAKKITK